MRFKKTCVICSGEFETSHEGRKCCSGKCRFVWNRHRVNVNRIKKLNEKKPHNKKCIICGIDFSTRNKAQVTCLSDECRKKNQSQKKSDSQKARRIIAPIHKGDSVVIDAICPGCGNRHKLKMLTIDVGIHTPRKYCRNFPTCVGMSDRFMSYSENWECSTRALI